MPDSFSQSNRIGSIKTPFGDDQLVLTKFDGTEGVSQLFEFHAEGISSQADLDFDSAIGKASPSRCRPSARGRAISAAR